MRESSEERERVQAAVIMRIAACGGYLRTWQPQGVLPAGAFGFDHPQRELRKPLLWIGKRNVVEIETQHIVYFRCELFRHQRLPPRNGFPIDVPLRFAGNISTDAGVIVAFASEAFELRAKCVAAADRERRISFGRRIHDIPL